MLYKKYASLGFKKMFNIWMIHASYDFIYPTFDAVFS